MTIETSQIEMTESRIFNYQAAGSEPGLLVVEHQNGVTRITMRGEPTLSQVTDLEQGLLTIATPGPIATLALPGAEAAALAVALLQVPPIEDLVGAMPHVCWFETTAERDAFVALVKERNPLQIEIRRTG